VSDIYFVLFTTLPRIHLQKSLRCGMILTRCAKPSSFYRDFLLHSLGNNIGINGHHYGISVAWCKPFLFTISLHVFLYQLLMHFSNESTSLRFHLTNDTVIPLLGRDSCIVSKAGISVSFSLQTCSRIVPILKCKCTERHVLTIFPRSHFLGDLAQNLLPQMPDKAWHNMMVGGA